MYNMIFIFSLLFFIPWVNAQCDANIATIAPAAGAVITNSDYYIQTSKGLNTGQTVVSINGMLDVFSAINTRNWLSQLPAGTATEWAFPTTTSTVSLITTSITSNPAVPASTDTSGGTGCNTVSVIGLNAAGNEISETVTLNAALGVSTTTTNTFSFVNRLQCVTTGSAGRNTGLISLNTGPAPTASGPRIGLAGIGVTGALGLVNPPGTSISYSGAYKVPTGKSFIFTGIDASSYRLTATSTTVSSAVYIFYKTTTGPRILFDKIVLEADGAASISKPYETSIVLAAGTYIWTEGVVHVTATNLQVTVWGVIY